MENRMAQFHPSLAPQGFSYSPGRGQFVAVPAMPVSQASSSLAPPNVLTATDPRPKPQSINDMEFWDGVFPKAMERLRETPELRKDPKRDWSIRHLTNWPDVQAKLEMSCRDYEFQHNPQAVGKFRRKVRGVLDKSSATLQQAVKVIPSMDIVSPITKVAELLLDVRTTRNIYLYGF